MPKTPKGGQTPPVTTFETFRPPGSYTLRQMQDGGGQPSAMNGEIRVRRFRVTVTIEPIDEPDDVIAERLQTLYRTPLHIDTRNNLRRLAAALGVNLER